MPISPSFINSQAFNGPSRLWQIYAENSQAFAPGAALGMYGGSTFNTNWALWYPGLGNFCIESWMYFSGSQQYSTLWTLGGNGTILTSDLGIGIMNESPTYGGDGIHWQLAGSLQGISNSTYGTIFNGGTDPLNNCWIEKDTWYHVAMTRSSGTVNLWLNGVLSATTSYGTNMTNPSGTSATISMFGVMKPTRYDAGNWIYNFTGSVRNTRYTVGNPVYTTAFTPPSIATFLPPLSGSYFKIEPMPNSGDYAYDPGNSSFGSYTFTNEIRDPSANYGINALSSSNSGDQTGFTPGIVLYAYP